MGRPGRTVAPLLALALIATGSNQATADEAEYAWSAVAVQQPPPTMHPGQIVALTITVRNEGTETWVTDGASEAPTRLAAVAPRDRSSPFALQDPTWLWSNGRRIRMATPVVPPGGIAAFTFSFRAPEMPPYARAFTERFAPVVEGVAWMDTNSIALTTSVQPVSSLVPAIPAPPPVPAPPGSSYPDPDPTLDWEPVSVQQPPATMHPGQAVTLSVVLRNTGSATWNAEELSNTPMRLAAVNAPGIEPRERASLFGRDDPTWIWSSGRRIRMTTPEVGPGQLGTFTFTFTAPTLPAYPQTFIEHFAPIVEDVALLDADTIRLNTQVRPAAGPIPPIPDTPPIPPSPIPTPTLPAIPSNRCPTTATPSPEDLYPPAVALGYDQSGSLLKGKVGTPTAVAYGFSKVLATDTVADRVAKTDPAGFATEYFGSSGSGPGQMRWPSGVTISDSAIIFVADTGNDRVQAFGFAGIYLAQFGARGDEPGQYRSPRGISMIQHGPYAGNLAIADTGNDRIQIISRTGDPIAVIGGPGDGPGELSSPSAVSAWGSHFFVADTGNERIVRFNADGSFAGSWGGPGTDAGCTARPTGLVASAYGVFVVEETHVEHFTRWGGHLATFGSLDTPSGIAMDSSARLYVAESSSDRLVRFSAAASAAPPAP